MINAALRRITPNSFRRLKPLHASGYSFNADNATDSLGACLVIQGRKVCVF